MNSYREVFDSLMALIGTGCCVVVVTGFAFAGICWLGEILK